MVRIHGIAYLIIGIIVAIYSYTVNPEKLQVFMWAGIGFAVFGLIRTLMDHLKKPPIKKPAPTKIVKKFCSYCGAALHNFQHFCHNCGKRSFHK